MVLTAQIVIVVPYALVKGAKGIPLALLQHHHQQKSIRRSSYLLFFNMKDTVSLHSNHFVPVWHTWQLRHVTGLADSLSFMFSKKTKIQCLEHCLSHCI